jgi:hypothetical protein
VGRVGGDVDHGASGAHDSDGASVNVKDAIQIDGESLAPLLIRHRQEGLVFVDRGAWHQEVDFPEALEARPHRRRGIVRTAGVVFDRLRSLSRWIKRARQLANRGFLNVGQQHARPSLIEELRDRGTDAAACACEKQN